MATSGLHHTRETPTDSTFAEIQALNKLNDEQFRELAQVLLTFLVEPGKAAWLMEQVEAFSSQHGVGLASLKNIVKSWLNVLRNCLKLNLTSSQVTEDLITLGLAEDRASFFQQQWESNQVNMSKGILSNTLMVNRLIDMDWKFGVTAASSELNKLGSTFLQVKLVLDKGYTTEEVHMELSLSQFYSFLHEMEKAKATLDYLS